MLFSDYRKPLVQVFFAAFISSIGSIFAVFPETRLRLADTGMRVLDVEVLRIRPDKDPAEALHMLDAAAELDARYVLVNCNDPDQPRLVDRLRELSREARQRNLRLGVEFMVFTDVPTLDDALTLIHDIDDPGVVVVVDALHLQRSGGTPSQLADIPSDLLPYAQLCDGPLLPIKPPPDLAMAEARTGRRLPGEGQLPLRDIVATLSPTTALSVEAPNPDTAQRTPRERAQPAFRALTATLERPCATSARQLATHH